LAIEYALQDIGYKYATRCYIQSFHWSVPDQIDKAYLEKADIGLGRIAQIASQLLAEISGYFLD
jgi:hypothetical protein